VHDRQDSRVDQCIAVGSGKLEAVGRQVGEQKHQVNECSASVEAAGTTTNVV
jgi:hypothetical protein